MRAAGARRPPRALALMLAPFAPFAAEELWREVLGDGESVHRVSLAHLRPRPRGEDTVTLVVQVDGKVRDRIEVAADANEDAVRELARASESARRAIGGREVQGDRSRAEARQHRVAARLSVRRYACTGTA